MSTSEEFRKFPPSPEVEAEMARAQIRKFIETNVDYRQFAELIFNHPTTKRLVQLGVICEEIYGASEPLTETMFFRDISPDLVAEAVNALVDETNNNMQLAYKFDDEDEPNDELDNEFKQNLEERLLSGEEVGDSLEPGEIPIEPSEMSLGSLVEYLGSFHDLTIEEIYNNLVNTGQVDTALENEEHRRERFIYIYSGAISVVSAAGVVLTSEWLKRRNR